MKPSPDTGPASHPARSNLLGALLGLATALLLAGCGFLRPQVDPTRFYVLTSTPAAATIAPTPAPEGGPQRLRVGLKPVELPRYLQSRSIVVRTGTNEVQFAEFDRWAEPLDQAIGRVLKENLLLAPNVTDTATHSRGEGAWDCEVAVRILYCEGVRGPNGSGSVHFAATWETRSLGTNSVAPKAGNFTAEAVAWDGKDYGQLAGRLSEALAATAKAMAADLPAPAKR